MTQNFGRRRGILGPRWLKWLQSDLGRFMGYESDVAKRYRDHAEELRTIAAGDRDYKIRTALLRIAADYERLAATMEALGRSHRHVRPTAI